MSFRWRVILLSAAAVAAAVAIASAIVYLLVSAELHGRVDSELERDATVTFDRPIFRGGELTPPDIGAAQRGPGGQAERGDERDRRESGGQMRSGSCSRSARSAARLRTPSWSRATAAWSRPPGSAPGLPATEEAIAIAAGERPRASRTPSCPAGTSASTRRPSRPGRRSRSPARSTRRTSPSSRLALILAAVSLGGVVLGGAFGFLISRAALSPVGRLSRAASEVATTRDLSHRIDPAGGHELAELARSFNRMLTALEGSLDSQRQLVADASHELRTPLASLRTNIEVLAHSETMEREERERLLADVIAQLDELTGLVGDLVDLARDAELDEPVELLRLDRLTEDAVEVARVRAPSARIELTTEPCLVRGSEHALTRAVSNLLDNAIKWSPPGGPIEVARVGRRDARGARPRARDRRRATCRACSTVSTARRRRAGCPASGLGLAIVRQVAESHGGFAEAAAPPDGGTLIRIDVPVARGRSGARSYLIRTRLWGPSHPRVG